MLKAFQTSRKPCKWFRQGKATTSMKQIGRLKITRALEDGWIKVNNNVNLQEVRTWGL